MIWLIMSLIICALCIAAYFLMTAAKKPSSAEDWISAWQYAHRGLHDKERPENSMSAFQAAVDAGYGIELDVRLSKDGEVMVFHDDDLMRMASEPGSVETKTAHDLSTVRLRGSSDCVPRLKDVLNMVDGRVPLLIETKEIRMSAPLHRKVIETLMDYKGLYAIQSFSPFAVWWFRKQAPWDPRGQLSYTFSDGQGDVPALAKFFVKHLLANFLGRPNFISYGAEGLRRRVVQRLRKHGVPILAWTVRSAREAASVRPFCDTIIFEGFRPAPWRRGA